MASFKSVAKANISNNSGSPTDIIAAAAVTSGKFAVIVGVSAVNKSANPQEVTLTLVKANTDTAVLCNRLPLAVNSGFELCAGNKYVLETGDKVTAFASAVNSVDVVCSYMLETQGA